MKKASTIIRIIAAVLIMVFGVGIILFSAFEMIDTSDDFWTYYDYYNGDAYTGIQQAAADASNNVIKLINMFELASLIGGFLVVFVGLYMLGLALVKKDSFEGLSVGYCPPPAGVQNNSQNNSYSYNGNMNQGNNYNQSSYAPVDNRAQANTYPYSNMNTVNPASNQTYGTSSNAQTRVNGNYQDLDKEREANPLKFALKYALKYESDEGMINYLMLVDNDTVREILKNRKEDIRYIIERTLESMN